MSSLTSDVDANASLRALEQRLTSALDLLDQAPDPTSKAWTDLLDWSQPSRQHTAWWQTNYRTQLFGWPSVQGPQRPWTDT